VLLGVDVCEGDGEADGVTVGVDVVDIPHALTASSANVNAPIHDVNCLVLPMSSSPHRCYQRAEGSIGSAAP
jgi:hypothetical protein